MIIEKNKVVSVSYHLTTKEEDGKETLVEKTEDAKPFVFLYGSGGLLEEFEKNLNGKKTGDTFDFFIDAKNAYGERDTSHIVSIPSDSFKDDAGKFDSENVKVGSVLPMVDNHGNKLQGLVTEITADNVKMDFNHPLAGQELHFKGNVLEIRQATDEELSHGHVHGPGGHHH